MSQLKYILDIEGTVCPISFVKDTLYPFFLKQVESLVKTNDPTLQNLLAQFPVPQDASSLHEHIESLVNNDIKDSVLKQLQGYIWEQGYKSGEIKAPVYPDAIDFIQRHAPNVYIYSSGSVKAQILLFQHVEGDIDLTKSIAGYFDINTSGKKTEPQSYTNILKSIGVPPSSASDVVFISDNDKELDAALDVGISTILALRPGNNPVSNAEKYKALNNFSSI
ncbi:putative acireductone synthase UTR4 [Kluyveromyces lactis]|uniref:Enolase-phosphatase E1 n=1 Tax=Kluyveromyces lactis (strain ATCC 8585 / CBS 2359 / DSM 70799 / NBRC 1267 / NRRL Y-1140 / WM37) TaxID=284590 RepID=ENOPH_KLULA|nr:uncharacterized protein KLLA0_E22111g [Kluyveromyces lactis]Q6CM87.1 RecName: Full=Enolase-phosphatase E1; AltName: Full=2,3-diketo-5-methylthio-1-phosphopentane phosphatase [Kluyveromyces lactis NRRL Y-1140]CAH00039.1 KLLA0E22111p [Kluyveromyces lactis]|eukprot:XP_454952.1 uncharacterized protein KLLA0_E22111g [Kluyveromyces lactis]